MSDALPKKSLGQHWLFDTKSLVAMREAAEVSAGDTVLEVGPGLGTLTEILLKKGANVTAVEFDKTLASELPQNIIRRAHSAFLEKDRHPELDSGSNKDGSTKGDADNDWIPDQVQKDKLQVVSEDILQFDLTQLPKDYKVCANIPYYLTSNLIRRLLENDNPPAVMALLIQKEVAERIAAEPGEMSILAVASQFYAEVELRELVPAKLFTPPPKVDSQIIQIKRRQQPLFPDVDTKKFFSLVRAGFSEKRKKLRSSLSGGLHIPKTEVDDLLKKSSISPDARAQELSLAEWHHLFRVMEQYE